MNKNSEIIRGVYAAFADGDVPRVLGALDGDVRWTEAEGFPYGGTYVGPDAVLANVFAKLGSEWEGFKAVPHTFVAEGDTVVALGEYEGTYKATGRRFSAPFAHVWTLRDGKVARFQQYTDTALAQAAVK
ncbi:MAG TPA: nuclear transport factor 2 family protein [Pyrinomonadaceae bacterium]|jgi:ketosteroid isomerase-like protein|nr:nuclear transport factor 2 family protein [Pyrinomonadaceae bacterium]